MIDIKFQWQAHSGIPEGHVYQQWPFVPRTGDIVVVHVSENSLGHPADFEMVVEFVRWDKFGKPTVHLQSWRARVAQS